MAVVYAFLADGLEEVECLATADVLIRAGVKVKLVSITGKKEVKGAHGFGIHADTLLHEIDPMKADLLFLPGGMPGTVHLGEDDTVSQVIREFAKEGKLVAAICAAPSVLGAAGLLEGRHATCHPGFEEKLTGAITSEDAVVVDGNIITSRGMGTAIDFGLAIVDCLTDFDEEVVEHVKKGIVYRNFEEV